MNKEEVLLIALSFEDLLKELQTLSKSYKMSLWLENIFKKQKLDKTDVWYEYRNDRWVLILTENNYLITRPYSIYCKDYLDTKK